MLLIIKIDIAINYEDRLLEAPKILKSISVYQNDKGEIISYLLADYMKNTEICR